MYQRVYQDLGKTLQPWRVLVIYGPRRVWKTTLVQSRLERNNLASSRRKGTWDDLSVHQVFHKQTLRDLEWYIQGYSWLFLDEAQSIPKLWVGLKLLIDKYPNFPIIVTWSSSFDLSQQISESLTWRKTILQLYPLSVYELHTLNDLSRYDIQEQRWEYLITWMYPQIVSTQESQKKKEYLSELTNSYLFKDILQIDHIRWSERLIKLVQLLALQIGQEVSFQELWNQVWLNLKTVEKYIDILQKWFVIYKLPWFHGNLRNSIRKKSKYYFWDVWVRNSLIKQLQPLDLRQDIWHLRENFVIMERVKFLAYSWNLVNQYFWRNYQWQEIDLIEEADGHIVPYEIKRSETKKGKIPSQWKKGYPESILTIVRPSSIQEIIS